MSEHQDLLRALPYFTGLSDDLLEVVLTGAEELSISEGETVIREGDIGDSLYILLDGELEVTKRSGDRDVVISRVQSGEVQGELALLEDAKRTATVTAVSESKLLRIPAASFRSLLQDPDFSAGILQTVIRRLRETELSLQHNERMAALGKMAAQLMHELNNPAAALSRSVGSLTDVYERLGDVTTTIMNGQDREVVGPSGPPNGKLEASEREDEVSDWLDSHGVPEPWKIASSLVDRGWTADDLDDLAEGSDEASALAEWIGLRLLALELIDQTKVSASRISELVGTVKGYSFLDQAPVQEVDIRTGIDDTIVLLKHKLVDVELELDIPEDLPKVTASGRDLNQVWTNLIDNAADAMHPEGTLRISASAGPSSVTVEVFNTGDPIPEEVRSRLFDPFFTTKEPGEGMGLGLHTVYMIVNQLGGSIEATSSDEGTTFRVELPLTPAAG